MSISDFYNSATYIYVIIGLLIATVMYLIYWAFSVERIAYFHDDKGKFHSKRNFSKKEKHFEHFKGRYNVDEINGSVLEDRNFLGRIKYKRYAYTIGNPNPILFDKKGEPKLSPELYNINIKTEIASKLNDLSKEGLEKWLTAKNIVIGIIMVVVIIYFANGGTLTGGA